jgi:hypothetical protein
VPGKKKERAPKPPFHPAAKNRPVSFASRECCADAPDISLGNFSVLMIPDFDPAAAHRYFSADCFNKTWELIDKANRTRDEDRRMLSCAFASLWHWTQREDCTDKNLSIGFWQISRVYSLLGESVNAAEYADQSLLHAAQLEPFYRGYAHEALARAATVEGHTERAAHHLKEAFAFASQVNDVEERAMLEKDLQSLR